MKVMFDTSALIPAMIKAHPQHKKSHTCLKMALNNEIDYLVSSHSIAECYSVLTSLPISPKITPNSANHLIEYNIKKSAKIINITSTDYFHVLTTLVNLELYGGIIYDALILRAAEKSNSSVLLTYNIKDFNKLLPSTDLEIKSPDQFL
ncbi:MAG: PIN domain-containing protein [bacterium]